LENPLSPTFTNPAEVFTNIEPIVDTSIVSEDNLFVVDQITSENVQEVSPTTVDEQQNNVTVSEETTQLSTVNNEEVLTTIDATITTDSTQNISDNNSTTQTTQEIPVASPMSSLITEPDFVPPASIVDQQIPTDTPVVTVPLDQVTPVEELPQSTEVIEDSVVVESFQL
jgi:hypothetical protein